MKVRVPVLADLASRDGAGQNMYYKGQQGKLWLIVGLKLLWTSSDTVQYCHCLELFQSRIMRGIELKYGVRSSRMSQALCHLALISSRQCQFDQVG